MGVWIETFREFFVWPQRCVTPFVGVWIETKVLICKPHRHRGHTLRGCVDWNQKTLIWNASNFSHTLRGCVDWNSEKQAVLTNLLSHTLRGCVDWNNLWHKDRGTLRSHTLRGCVDWNNLRNINRKNLVGHTLRGCVDWNGVKRSLWPTLNSHTLRGCVDWNTYRNGSRRTTKMSHPSWVCGLKLISNRRRIRQRRVTPFVGVWIET